jgi:DNA-binding transcriptional LysR family regulator
MYLLPAIDRFRREFPQVSVTVHRMLASRIPEELNLRTFELGMISFRPDPAQFRTIAVYADSLAFIVSPNHPLAGASASRSTTWERVVHRPQRGLAVAAEGDRGLSALPDAVEHGHRAAHHRGHQAVCGHGQRGGAGAPPDGGPGAGDRRLVRVPVDELESSGCCGWRTGGRPRSPMPPGPFCAR